MFERIVGYANDLGLLAEEINPETAEQLGKLPQGFTHIALIGAAVNLAKVARHGPEQQAETERSALAVREAPPVKSGMMSVQTDRMKLVSASEVRGLGPTSRLVQFTRCRRCRLSRTTPNSGSTEPGTWR